MTFTFGMAVDLCIAHMLVLVSMTLYLMQGHSGPAKVANIQCRIISKTYSKQHALHLLTKEGPFLLHDLDFANVYMA